MAWKSHSQGPGQQEVCKCAASLATGLSVKANNWKQPKCPGTTVREQVVVSPYSGLHAHMAVNQLRTILQSGSTTAS